MNIIFFPKPKLIFIYFILFLLKNNLVQNNIIYLFVILLEINIFKFNLNNYKNKNFYKFIILFLKILLFILLFWCY